MEEGNILIDALSQYKHGDEALGLFTKMNGMDLKPDVRSFVSKLSSCSHAGLVDKGCQLFSVILKDYGIKSNREY